MPRMQPLTREDVPELSDLLDGLEERMGFLSNDLMTMARKPAMLRAFLALMRAVNDPGGKLPSVLRSCISHLAARTVGCQYCSDHTQEFAARAGADREKLANIWEYERSPLFTESERAALRFAQRAASVPNAVTDDDYQALREHFDEDEIVEILFSVCLSGVFTRWNQTMGTEPEHG